MAGVTESFRALVNRIDLVRCHSFDNGFDDGAYYNFTFGTDCPADLWRLMQETIFQVPEHQGHLTAASMAVCSAEDGWHEYVQLYHWDPQVPLVSAAAL
ncbi:hypothetical protein AGMMS49545_06350 [Betaproteobacteria bacterium]|nr:hypothetical protein AGMMS49545_06350 [Betaproteobacteria bacterium]